MSFPYLFYPVLLIALILAVATFFLILTTKASSETITRVSSAFSISLAVVALFLSVYSTYFVYEQSKLPELELEVRFIESGGKLPAERAPILSQLGGIYELLIKNVGDKDAVFAWANGRLRLEGGMGENIDRIELQYNRISKGSITNPYPLKKLMPSSSYYMSITASCTNCLGNKSWWVEINTEDRSISVRPGSGLMWEKVEFW